MNGVYWIYADAFAPLTPPLPGLKMLAPMPLAIVLCPRGGRLLHTELSHLKRSGIQTLVSLLSEEQVRLLQLEKEGREAKRLGMRFLHHPIPDHCLPPDPRAFRTFIDDLAQRLRAGEHVGIHCWGSIGRATLAAAATLIHLGWQAQVALESVEVARGCPVPDTNEQKNWILNYQAQT